LTVLLLSVGAAQPLFAQRMDRIQVVPVLMKLVVGDTGLAKFLVLSKDGSIVPHDSLPLAVESRRPSVAVAIHEKGQVIIMAVAPGIAVVEVKSGDLQTGRLRVEVVEAKSSPRPAPNPAPAHGSAAAPAAVELRIPSVELRLAVGERDRIGAEALDGDGAPIPNAPIRFQLSRPNVIALDEVTGRITAQSPGEVFIWVSVPGAQGQSVSVTVVASTFRIDPDTLRLLATHRDTLRLVVEGLGHVYRGPVTWTSLNPAVANIDPSTGAVTAVGTVGGPVSVASVRAAAGGRDTYGSVVVLQPPPEPPGGLLWSVGQPPVELLLPLGDSRPLRGAAVDRQQDTMYLLPLRWTLALDSGVLVYDVAAGRLTARRQGLDTLIARVLLPFVPNEFRWPVRVVRGGIGFRQSRTGIRIGGLDSFPLLLDSTSVPAGSRLPVEWQVQPATVAKHLGQGIVEAVGPGRAEITARMPWDSTARATVLVPPDLVYSHAARTAEGRRYAELRGVNLRTEATTSLTGMEAVDEQASISPDRTMIAFVRSERQGDQNIWVMDVDGKEPSNVTPDSADEKGPFWSADGRSLFYIAAVAGRGDRLFIADPDGRNSRPFLRDSFPVASGAISPDGRFLTYSSPRNGKYDLFTVPLSTTGPLTPISGEAPVWALPRHDMLLPQYARATGDLYFIQRERGGKSSQVLMRLPARAREPQAVSPVGLLVLSFAVAADGQQVVVVALRPQGPAREQRAALYMLDVRQPGAAIPQPWREEAGVTFATPVFAP
jgi:hypothetical protein